jgi:hypothetical protein
MTIVAIGVICSFSISAAMFALVLNARKRLRPFAADLLKTPDAEEQKRLRKTIRTLTVYEFFFAFVLVYGLSLTHDQPWTIRIVGVAINVFIFQVPLVHGILRARRRLRGTNVLR